MHIFNNLARIILILFENLMYDEKDDGWAYDDGEYTFDDFLASEVDDTDAEDFGTDSDE